MLHPSSHPRGSSLDSLQQMSFLHSSKFGSQLLGAEEEIICAHWLDMICMILCIQWNIFISSDEMKKS